MKEEISVSVILPVYNGSEYLRECLESVITQNSAPDEIVVINDGSTDNSWEIIKQFKGIKSVNTANCGVASARNTGIELAKGNWICFIDQDDIWLADSIKVRKKYVVSNPHTSIVTGRQKWFLDGLKEIPPWVKSEQMKKDLDGYLLGCAMIRKELFDVYGNFDTSFRYGSDFDWFFRLKDGGVDFHQLDELVLRKRIHHQNESRNAQASLKELSKAIFHSIKRKRQ